MQRRDLIKTIALASIGSTFLVGCQAEEKSVMEFLVDNRLDLNAKHKAYLAEISETILPIKNVSDKIENPVDFILNMLNDVLPKKDLRTFATGFEEFKQLMIQCELKINASEPAEAVDVINEILVVDAMEAEAKKAEGVEEESSDDDELETVTPREALAYFVNTTRGLSIWNLKSSEFFETEKKDYKMIPDTYEACIEV